MDTLQVRSFNKIGTYLGCRNIDSKRTRGDFAIIKEKICCKLSGWKARVLSQTGETVLLKSNVACILLFTMQGIKISNYIIKELDGANIDFSGSII